MKKIELKQANYLRYGVQKAIINQYKLDFVYGLAIAEATVSGVMSSKEKFTYNAYGVINENYEEAFNGNTCNKDASNLMFLGCNKEIVRCGPFDFITTVLCGDEQNSFYQYRHIHIQNGEAFLLMNSSNPFEKTNIDSIYLLKTNDNKYCLYDILNGQLLTPSFFQIVNNPHKNEIFDVLDELNGYYFDEFGNLVTYTDYLSFAIDVYGRICTPIFSAIMNRNIYNFGVTNLSEYNFLRKGHQRILEKEKINSNSIHLIKKK